MSEKNCPNCGIDVPGTAENCTCGFTFVDYDSEAPAPGIVRSGGIQEDRMAQEAMALQPEPEAAPSKTSAKGRSKASDRKPTKVPAAAAAKPASKSEGSSHRQNLDLLMSCPSCDATISSRALKCPKCGSAPYEHCLVCAARVLANNTTCPECGDPDPFGDSPEGAASS